ncbi:MAG: HlyD family efflux transporter periplasmic adaptor subunit [Phormidesmis sp.]
MKSTSDRYHSANSNNGNGRMNPQTSNSTGPQIGSQTGGQISARPQVNPQIGGPINNRTTGRVNPIDPLGGGAMPPNGNGGGSEFSSHVPQSFDKPVILRQSPKWARWIAISIMGVTTASVLSAFIFKVDESIGAQGKLEPEGIVQVVQAPVGGVVEQVLVTEGELVDKGQVVVTLDETSTEAQLKTNEENSKELQAENAYYSAILSGDAGAVAPADIASELAERGRDRAQLQASNQLYRAQLSGNTSGLSADQIAQLEASKSRLGSQQSINKIEASQARNQRVQTEVQLANAKSDLSTNKEILESFRELNEKGAVARLSFLQQQQEVSTKQAEVDKLQEELDRLTLQISGAEEEVGLTSSTSDETLYQRIEANTQRIADIDSQLSQRILDNNQQIAELRSQKAQLTQNITNQALTAPVKGTVFNLKANRPGYVANSTEPMMEIVPQDSLVARIFIPNKDIGFVKVGQKVDVRIDAFSYSEFGDVEGTLTSIGTDALPPDETFPYFRFPAEITLDDQQFMADGVPLELRSGMSLSANIKLRKRRIITFFTDIFRRKADSLTSGT